MSSTLTASLNLIGTSPSATLFLNLVFAHYSISRLIADLLDAVSWIEGCPSARFLVVLSSESVSLWSSFYWCVNRGFLFSVAPGQLMQLIIRTTRDSTLLEEHGVAAVVVVLGFSYLFNGLSVLALIITDFGQNAGRRQAYNVGAGKNSS